MCRVRFGLTGIYFDPLEPSRPRDEVFQQLIAPLPPVVQNKQDIVPQVIGSGAIKEDAAIVTKTSENEADCGQRQSNKDPSDSSSSSSRDEEICLLSENAKTNCGSKRLRDSSSSPSSSVSSSPFSDEDQVHKSTNSKVNFQDSKPPKPVISPTTQQCNKNQSKRHNFTPPRGLSKAPPAKRVRFAMNVQERVIPSDDASDASSSHSSDDSYTDSPSPTTPYDVFAGYMHKRDFSRTCRMDGRMRRSTMQFPTEEEIDDEGFLDSEDGSEVDVQDLPIKGHPPRTVRARDTSTALARSQRSGRIMEQSRVTGNTLESNVDNGLHLDQSHASQTQRVSPPQLGGLLRYPKLRSGKILPEPIFVVRPRFLSDAKEKGKPASSGIAKNRHEGTKTPPRLARAKASKNNTNSRYQAPSVSDDFQRDADFHKDLGRLIRDI